MHHTQIIALMNTHHVVQMKLLRGVKGRLDNTMSLNGDVIDRLEGTENGLRPSGIWRILPALRSCSGDVAPDLFKRGQGIYGMCFRPRKCE